MSGTFIVFKLKDGSDLFYGSYSCDFALFFIESNKLNVVLYSEYLALTLGLKVFLIDASAFVVEEAVRVSLPSYTSEKYDPIYALIE